MSACSGQPKGSWRMAADRGGTASSGKNSQYTKVHFGRVHPDATRDEQRIDIARHAGHVVGQCHRRAADHEHIHNDGPADAMQHRPNRLAMALARRRARRDRSLLGGTSDLATRCQITTVPKPVARGPKPYGRFPLNMNMLEAWTIDGCQAVTMATSGGSAARRTARTECVDRGTGLGLSTTGAGTTGSIG